MLRRHRRRSARRRPAAPRDGERPCASRRGCCRSRWPTRRGRCRRAAATSIASAKGTRTRSESAPPQSPPKAPKPYIERGGTLVQSPVWPRAAARARATGDLEGHHDEVSGRDATHVVADLGHLGDELVADGDRARDRRVAAQDRLVEVAQGHRERPHERLAGALQRGRRDVPPLHLPVGRHRELLHQSSGGCRSARSWRPAARSTSAFCRARASTSAPSSVAMVRSARRAALLASKPVRLQARAQGRQPALRSSLARQRGSARCAA